MNIWISIVGWLGLVAMLPHAGIRTEASPDRVTFSVKVVSEVTLHEPVVMTFAVANESSQPATVDWGLDCTEHFAFDVVGPDRLRHTTRVSHGEGGYRGGAFPIGPGVQYAQGVVLDEWLDFSKVGTYLLTVRFDGVIRPAAGVTLDLARSQTFSVTVVPRDENRLRAKCEALMAPVYRCCNDAQTLAVSQLSYLRDPVAVPFLEKATADRVSTLFFETLFKIGGPDARQALERLATNPNAEVAHNAKVTLLRMK